MSLQPRRCAAQGASYDMKTKIGSLFPGTAHQRGPSGTSGSILLGYVSLASVICIAIYNF